MNQSRPPQADSRPFTPTVRQLRAVAAVYQLRKLSAAADAWELHDADAAEGFVSVLSPVGAGLLGLCAYLATRAEPSPSH